MGNQYLTPAQLAARWGYAQGTLSNMRSMGRGPKFFRPGGGKRGPVRYRVIDVEAYETKLANGEAE